MGLASHPYLPSDSLDESLEFRIRVEAWEVVLDLATGTPVGRGRQPTRMCHICKNMQNVVQKTATRLVTIIGVSCFSLSNTALAAFISLITRSFAVALEARDSRGGPQPDCTPMCHHGVHNFHEKGLFKGLFLHCVHRAQMSLGPGRAIIAFVLGANFILSHSLFDAQS